MLKHVERTTALADAGLVGSTDMAKLRAVGVTTVEELVAMIRCDAPAMQRFVPGLDLPQVQSDAARMTVSAFGDRLEIDHYEFPSLGAAPPDDVQIERVASQSTFDAVFTEAAAAAQTGQPEELKVDLRKLFGPIRDQGKRGTCVGHAGAAVVEGLFEPKEGKLSLSPQFLFYEAKQRDGSPKEDGTWLKFAMPTTVDTGICLERDCPYNPNPIKGNIAQGPPSDKATKGAAKHKTIKWEPLTETDTSAMVKVLDGGRPLAVAIPVYQNWYGSAAVALTGIIPMPLPSSKLEGGHALCVAGYGYDDDIPGNWYFVIRNSWGTKDFGTQSEVGAGYGALPFLYVSKYGWEAATASIRGGSK